MFHASFFTLSEDIRRENAALKANENVFISQSSLGTSCLAYDVMLRYSYFVESSKTSQGSKVK